MIKGISAASISPMFLEHVAEHGLNFATTEEFEFRQNIFNTKEAENIEINSNPENTFTVGHNFMSTMTQGEKKKMLGYVAPTIPTEIVTFPASNDDEVNWVTKGGVTPVKNQAQCGEHRNTFLMTMRRIP